MTAVADDFDLSGTAVREWVLQAEVDEGKREGLISTPPVIHGADAGDQAGAVTGVRSGRVGGPSPLVASDVAGDDQTMASKSTGDATVDALYAVRKGTVAFVEVPEFGFVMIDGGGAPGGEAFTDALQALYSVSYRAHFAVKKARGEAPRVMALEALWWVEGAEAQAIMERVAAGDASIEESDRDQWHWRAMIMQLPPIDQMVIEQAITGAKAKKDLASLDALRYERWAEGSCAQILHIGPYATESTSIVALHKAIADHGSRPRGRHHEIYLGDPRTAAPEKLRTILRQPIEPLVRGE